MNRLVVFQPKKNTENSYFTQFQSRSCFDTGIRDAYVNVKQDKSMLMDAPYARAIANERRISSYYRLKSSFRSINPVAPYCDFFEFQLVNSPRNKNFCVVSGNLPVVYIDFENNLVDSNLDIEKEAKSLYISYQDLLKNKNEEIALLHLYSSLRDNLKRIEFCDYFLKSVMVQKNSSAFIVHVLNALSPLKHKLIYWDAFYIESERDLTSKFGINMANNLMKAAL